MSTSIYKNIVATVVGLALVFAVAFSLTSTARAAALSQSQVDAIINLLVSFGADQATIDNVRSALTGQPTNNGGGNTGSNTGSGSCVPMVFTMNHQMGDRGGEVMNIQKFLNANGFQVAAAGPGSPGNETDYFGPATKAAVIRFQNAYASEILAPVGLTAGTGYWGNSTRAKANAMEQARCAQANNNDDNNNDDQQQDDQSDKLVVAAAAQPADSLAPANAARVPFTRFTLTAGSSDVNVNEVVVELSGLASRASFDKVVLLDEDGMQVGDEESIKSDRRATFNSGFVVKAGTTETFTVAANMNGTSGTDDVDEHAGEVASFAVVSIDANKDVEGTLPISGAQHTINATLSVAALGASYDSVSTTANVNDENTRLARITFTANNEDTLIKKVRLYNRGNAKLNEALDNIVIRFDGSDYDAEVDGDYLVVDFGSGVLLEEGDSETLEVKADVVGGTNDTIQFEIKDVADVIAVGNDYGYGAKVTTSGTPVTVTIQSGSVNVTTDTSFDNNAKVAAGTNEAPLAGFKVDVDGEDITADVAVVITSASVPAGTSVDNIEVQNMAIYKDGVRVSDLEDAVFSTINSNVTVTFTDVPFEHSTNPVAYVIKGNIDKDAPDAMTYTVNTVTLSNMETVSGENISGTAATTPNHSVEVAGTELTMRVSNPDETNVTPDTEEVVIAEIEFDAEDSGDDVRVTEVNLTSNSTFLSATKYANNCQLYVGTDRISNDKEDFTADNQAGTWDTDFVVSKGERATVMVKCDLGSFANGDTMGFDTPSFDATGEVTGTKYNNQAGTGSAAVNITMGSVTLDETTDNVNDNKAVKDDATSVVLAQIKVEARDADIEFDGVDFVFGGGDENNVDGDLDIYARKAGETTWTKVDGKLAAATTSFTNLNYDIAKDTTVYLEFRADMQPGGTGEINKTNAINITNWSFNYNGVAITPTNNVTVANLPQVTIVSALPVVEEVYTDTITMTASSLSDKRLLEFSIKADGGDVQVQQIALTGTGNVNWDNVDVRVYSDAAHNNLVQEDLDVTGAQAAIADATIDITDVTISDGDTYYFVVEADLAATSGQSSTVALPDTNAAIIFDLEPVNPTNNTPATTELDSDLVIPDEMKTTVNTAL